MGYSMWVSVVDKKGDIVKTYIKRANGQIYPLGITDKATLNVNYSYTKHFNFGQLRDMTVDKADEEIRKAIERLGDERGRYWLPTEGNVKLALTTLSDFAQYAMESKINAIFRVD